MQLTDIEIRNSQSWPSAEECLVINHFRIAKRNVLVYSGLNASGLSTAYTGRVGAGGLRSRNPRAYRPRGWAWGFQNKADRLFQQPSVRSHLGYLSRRQTVTVSNVLLFSGSSSRPKISPELQAELVAIRSMLSAYYKPSLRIFTHDWSPTAHAGNRGYVSDRWQADLAAKAASKNGGGR